MQQHDFLSREVERLVTGVPVSDGAGVKLKRNYNLGAPKGVNGRNSDNTLIQKVFGWEPATRLRDGMEKTYRWIYDELASGRASVVNRS